MKHLRVVIVRDKGIYSWNVFGHGKRWRKRIPTDARKIISGTLDIHAFLKPQKNLKTVRQRKKPWKVKYPKKCIMFHVTGLLNDRVSCQLWNCTHFRHPIDEQLRHIDNSSNNNLLSVPSKLEWIFESEESPFQHAPALVTVFESRNF